MSVGSMKGISLLEMKQESWMLRNLQLDYPPGISTIASRSELIRQAILTRGLAEVEAARTKQNRVLTWRLLFSQCYGVELVKREREYA